MKYPFTHISLVASVAALAFIADALGQSTKSDSVVKIQLEADKPHAEGIQVVSIKITIDEGWHLYANPVPQDFPAGGLSKPMNCLIF